MFRDVFATPAFAGALLLAAHSASGLTLVSDAAPAPLHNDQQDLAGPFSMVFGDPAPLVDARNLIDAAVSSSFASTAFTQAPAHEWTPFTQWRNQPMPAAASSPEPVTGAVAAPRPSAPTGPLSPLPSEMRDAINDARGINDVSAPNPVPAGAEPTEAPRVDYRGEQPPAAPIRYSESFEGDEIGNEWEGDVPLTSMESFGRFAGPMLPGDLTVNVFSETTQGMTVVFDIYILSGSLATSSDTVLASVQADGVEIWSRPVAELIEESKASSGEPTSPRGAFKPTILRDLKVGFQPLAEIAEIKFVVEGPTLTSVVWGIDNVRIDRQPDPTPGAFSSDADSIYFGLGGATLAGNQGPIAARGLPGGGGGGGGSAGGRSNSNNNPPRNPFDDDQIADESGDEDDPIDRDPPENDDPDDDGDPIPGGDNDIPTPGPAALFAIAAGALSSRRRR